MEKQPPSYGSLYWREVGKEEIIDTEQLKIKKIYVRSYRNFSVFPMVSMDGKNFSYMSPFLVIKGNSIHCIENLPHYIKFIFEEGRYKTIQIGY